MSSDMYQCNSCLRYRHELDMHRATSGVHVCKECCGKYEAVYFPGKTSSDLSPRIAPEAGPGSDHYTINKITPMEYVKGMGRDEYRGACILNIIKYISRAPYKGSELKDLEKAKWYIEQMIAEQVEWEAKDDKRE